MGMQGLWLQRVWVSGVSRLPRLRLWWLWLRLLRVVGSLPLVLDQTAFLLTLMNPDRGRVRQGRPGQSISSLQRCPRVRVAKPRHNI